MKSILETIADDTRLRVAKAKKEISFEDIRDQALEMGREQTFIFEDVLRQDGMSFICECKKASPSKGIISEAFPYIKIAKSYEAAGATCISVLTEPKWFMGKNAYLKEITETVNIPCLRKDFIVDEYMIYEAKLLGAHAVLLICALLNTATIKKYIEICDKLGLSALVEAHDKEEINAAIAAGARIIGINNRNLKDFTVDIHTSERLKQYVPDSIIFITESGIKTHEDIEFLQTLGVDAVLIGETFMRADDKKAMLHKLRGLA